MEEQTSSQQPNTNEEVPRGRRMPTEYLFLMNGIASLLGYNAVLSSLDYFSFEYSGSPVYSWFMPPLFLAYVLTAVTYRKVSNKFDYPTLLKTGLIVLNLVLVGLLVVSLVLPNTNTGFYLSMFLMFLLGGSANTYQLTFFAMINYLSQSVVSKFTIGTALSGLSITLVRIIIVAISGDNDGDTTSIIIYFAISVTFNFITLSQNLVFLKSREFKIKIQPFLPTYKGKESEEENYNEVNKEPLNSSYSKNELEKMGQSSVESSEISYFQLMLNTGRSIFPYPAIIFGNYIITFLVFPELTVSKHFDGLSAVWSGLLFILFYNIGDTVGKFICDYRWTFNSLSILYMFTSRGYFLVAIPLMATTVFDDDELINNYFYPFFVQFLLAVTNGVITSNYFKYCFRRLFY